MAIALPPVATLVVPSKSCVAVQIPVFPIIRAPDPLEWTQREKLMSWGSLFSLWGARRRNFDF